VYLGSIHSPILPSLVPFRGSGGRAKLGPERHCKHVSILSNVRGRAIGRVSVLENKDLTTPDQGLITKSKGIPAFYGGVMSILKRLIIISLFLLSFLFAFSQESGLSKGMCFDLGIGWMPLTLYPSNTQSVLDSLSAMPGVTEVQVNLNLNIGFFLWESHFSTWQSTNVSTRNYLTFGIDGYFTRLENDTGSLQLNNYVYGIGLESVTGGWLGRVNIGPATCVVQASGDGITESAASDTGFGVAIKVGYDFNTRKGFGLCLALNEESSWIDSEYYWALGLSVSLTYF